MSAAIATKGINGFFDQLRLGGKIEVKMPDPFAACRAEVIERVITAEKAAEEAARALKGATREPTRGLRRFESITHRPDDDPLKKFREQMNGLLSILSFAGGSESELDRTAKLACAVVRVSNDCPDIIDFRNQLSQYAQRRGGRITLDEAERIIGEKSDSLLIARRIETATKLLDARLPENQFSRLAAAAEGNQEVAKRIVAFAGRRQAVLDETALAGFERALQEKTPVRLKALDAVLSAVNNVEIRSRAVLDSDSLASIMEKAQRLGETYSSAVSTADVLSKNTLTPLRLFKELAAEFEGWLRAGVRLSTIKGAEELLRDRQLTIESVRALKEPLEAFPPNVNIDSVLRTIWQATGQPSELGQNIPMLLSGLRNVDPRVLADFTRLSQSDLGRFESGLKSLRVNGADRIVKVLNFLQQASAGLTA